MFSVPVSVALMLIPVSGLGNPGPVGPSAELLWVGIFRCWCSVCCSVLVLTGVTVSAVEVFSPFLSLAQNFAPFKCTCRLSLRAKFLPQCSHLTRFSPVWSFKCRLSPCFCENFLLHFLHIYFFSFSSLLASIVDVLWCCAALLGSIVLMCTLVAPSGGEGRLLGLFWACIVSTMVSACFSMCLAIISLVLAKETCWCCLCIIFVFK